MSVRTNGGVIKADDMPLPQKLRPTDIQDICGAYSIDGPEQAFLETRLTELVDVFRDHMRAGKKRQTTKQEREALRNAAEKIGRAAMLLSQRDDHGKRILKLAAKKRLSLMFNLDWLREQFPGDGLLPESERSGASPSRFERNQRGRNIRAPGDAKQARYYFASQQGPLLIVTALKELEAAINEGLKASKLKGGRIANQSRHDFLINLAIAWSEIGKTFDRGSGLSFSSFCEAIFSYVQWPLNGLNDAISSAVKDARSRRLIA